VGKLVVVISTALLVIGSLAVAQDDESVRIDVRQDPIEISASEDAWYLRHGWANLRVDRTSGMTRQEVESLLLEHYSFDLTHDGVAVAPAGVEVGTLVSPAQSLEVWVIAWLYNVDLAPGIHVLTGTWTTSELPCDFFVYGCVDPASWPEESSSVDFNSLVSVVDGLVSIVNSHTLTLIVLP